MENHAKFFSFLFVWLVAIKACLTFFVEIVLLFEIVGVRDQVKERLYGLFYVICGRDACFLFYILCVWWVGFGGARGRESILPLTTLSKKIIEVLVRDGVRLVFPQASGVNFAPPVGRSSRPQRILQLIELFLSVFF